MAPSNTPNLSQTGTFDPEKMYSGVIMQQGKPYVDTAWNDQFDAIQYHLGSGIGVLQGRGALTKGWRLVAVDREPIGGIEGRSLRNKDNFAITQGILAAPAGPDVTNPNFMNS